MPNCLYCNKKYKNYGFYYEKHIKECYNRLEKYLNREIEYLKNVVKNIPKEILKQLYYEHSKDLLDNIRNYIISNNHLKYFKNKYPNFCIEYGLKSIIQIINK